MEKIKVAIGSDHAGFELKKFLIENMDSTLHFEDLGTDSSKSCDFPDFANKVCKFILINEDYKGILICGTGVGMSIAANKIEGIRASNVTTVETAIQSVEHNNANVLCLGSNNLSQSLSKEIAINFFSSLLLEEDRYVRRIEKITKIENSN